MHLGLHLHATVGMLTHMQRARISCASSPCFRAFDRAPDQVGAVGG